MRPESAQEQHYRMIEERETKIPSKQTIENLIAQNEEKFLPETFSPPRDLTEAVMQKHGFTRSQADEELKKFGA
jgi:hypothetical protein